MNYSYPDVKSPSSTTTSGKENPRVESPMWGLFGCLKLKVEINKIKHH